MASIPSPLATGCGFYLFAMLIGCPFWVCVAMGGLAFALAPRVKQEQLRGKRDMERVTIEIDRGDLPPHTDDEFEEWVRFCVGYQADIDGTNPLSDMDMTAQSVMVG